MSSLSINVGQPNIETGPLDKAQSAASENTEILMTLEHILIYKTVIQLPDCLRVSNMDIQMISDAVLMMLPNKKFNGIRTLQHKHMTSALFVNQDSGTYWCYRKH